MKFERVHTRGRAASPENLSFKRLANAGDRHYTLLNKKREGAMRACCFSLVVALLLAGIAFPQASSSTVLGTVVDQAQAVVPDAKVSLINEETNVTRSTLTNQSGLYVFPGVIPGQ
jgi:hypothetical protein